MAGDWIKLHRKVIESQVFSDGELFRLWTYLLVRANYKPSFFRGVRVEIGQVAFSQRMLVETLGVSRGTIQRHLKKLEDMGNITVNASRDFSVVTISQWSSYQTADDPVRSTNGTTDEATDRTTNGSTDRTTNRTTNRTIPKKERSLRRKEGEELFSSEPPLASSEPSLMEFPTVGKVKSWALTQRVVDTLAAAFPDVDVMGQCRKAKGWCETNPSKRKTPGGMERFLFGWMERNQNRGRASPLFDGPVDDPRGNFNAAHQYLESLKK